MDERVQLTGQKGKIILVFGVTEHDLAGWQVGVGEGYAGSLLSLLITHGFFSKSPKGSAGS